MENNSNEISVGTAMSTGKMKENIILITLGG